MAAILGIDFGDRLTTACTAVLDAADAMFTKEDCTATGSSTDLEVLCEAVKAYRALMSELDTIMASKGA